jgi:hypothetical protein
MGRRLAPAHFSCALPCWRVTGSEGFGSEPTAPCVQPASRPRPGRPEPDRLRVAVARRPTGQRPGRTAAQGLADMRFNASDSDAAIRFAEPARKRAQAQRTFDVLALSGGGSNGAYGAGVLVGWTKRGERPEFDIVTGVSTGALTAPFAFLGPSWDDRLTQAYTGKAAGKILKPAAWACCSTQRLQQPRPAGPGRRQRHRRPAAGHRRRAQARPPPADRHHQSRHRGDGDLGHGRDRQPRRPGLAQAVQGRAGRLGQHSRRLPAHPDRDRGPQGAASCRRCMSTAASPSRSSWPRSRCCCGRPPRATGLRQTDSLSKRAA